MKVKLFHPLPGNTRGELFLSYNSLFQVLPEGVSQELSLDDNIPPSYLHEYLGSDPNDERSLSELLRRFNSAEELRDKISILTNLMKFQNSFHKSEALYNIVISNLASEYAPLVSIATDGLDSSFIKKDRNAVINRIKSVIVKQQNNPDFIEGIMSLVNLAERVDDDLYSEIIEQLRESQLYSIKKFIANKTGEKIAANKSIDRLNDFLSKAYNYKSALVKTEQGNFTIELLPEYAPISVGNFCNLANAGYYDGIIFHRVVPGFVIQCGDPTGTGWGGTGYEIISEYSPLHYEIGIVGMASAGKDTEGSQWFVTQGNYPHLNGRYTVFAKVIEGIEVVYRIDQHDKVLDIVLFP